MDECSEGLIRANLRASANLGCLSHKRGEHFASAGKGEADVHDGVVVHECKIAIFPEKTEGAFFGQCAVGRGVFQFLGEGSLIEESLDSGYFNFSMNSAQLFNCSESSLLSAITPWPLLARMELLSSLNFVTALSSA